jgi:hypothetical protein
VRIAWDEIVRVGGVTAAALAERSVHGQGSNGVALHGTKRPVVILVRNDDLTMAFEISGRPIALDEFVRRFPGQLAEFERIAIGDCSDGASQGESL